MIVTEKDFDRFIGKGVKFQTLVHALIMREAMTCGIAVDEVEWDDRINIADGGKDIVVHVGRKTASKYMPTTPSIWSCKSGKNGLEPSVLKEELNDHPGIINHLKAGGAFVWCTAPPSDSDTKGALRTARTDLCNKHGFSEDQIHFFHRDTLASWLDSHPGLIPIFLGTACPWIPVSRWSSDRHLQNPWVGFRGRDDVVGSIRDHLHTDTEANVLHITGLSGIGKTRTVLEACKGDPTLSDVLYFPNPSKFEVFEPHLIHNDQINARIVIDEVDISTWDSISTRLGSRWSRLRVVTIGPCPKGRGKRPGIMELEPPSTSSDVSEVLKCSHQIIDEKVAENISRWSEQDLRLALILLDSWKKDPEFRDQPIDSVENVYRRVTRLFEGQILDQNAFDRHYEMLSAFIDVGCDKQYREEFQYLADFLQESVTLLDRFTEAASRCGLGDMDGPFFEAKPGALARCIFQAKTWPWLRKSLPEFIKNMPSERLRRRFIERSQECSAPVRGEVAMQFAAWFLGWMPKPDLALILDRERSRVFQAYTELDPENGLRWLKRAVHGSSPEELLRFHGDPDGSGGWSGRRQVVWLCESLACFPEYFRDCEEVLFALALHENEKGLGNNSTGVWQGLFPPILSGTATPFQERLDLLLRRLDGAQTPEEITLVVDAVVRIVSHPLPHPTPPRVVGGRLVPEEWHPRTYQELDRVRHDAARQFLQHVHNLKEPGLTDALAKVAEHIRVFLDLCCIDGLAPLYRGGIRPDILRTLRAGIDEYTSWLIEAKADTNHPCFDQTLSWRKSIAPSSLRDRIIEVTNRPYWYLYSPSDSVETADKTYLDLATEICASPGVLDDLDDWFDGGSCPSSYGLGHRLGLLDAESILLSQIDDHLRQGKWEMLGAGYFNGCSRRVGGCTDQVRQFLDSIMDNWPKTVALISLQCDRSILGLERILKAVDLSPVGSASLLMDLRTQAWAGILSPDIRVKVLNTLVSLASKGDGNAFGVALKITSWWGHGNTEELKWPVSDVVRNIMWQCLNEEVRFDEWDWKQCAEKLPNSDIVDKVNLLATGLVSVAPHTMQLREHCLEILKTLGATYPEKVMQAVGEVALNPKTRTMFFVDVFHGLFESLDIGVVKDWVSRAGVEGARAIARHLESPHPLPENPLFVPLLTEWFLDQYSDDDRVFSEFCAGRHSKVAEWVPEDRNTESKVGPVRPYLNHPVRRIRQWAQYEIDEAERWKKFWRDTDARHNRA